MSKEEEGRMRWGTWEGKFGVGFWERIRRLFWGVVGVLCCFSIVKGWLMRDGNELLGAEGFYCF